MWRIPWLTRMVERRIAAAIETSEHATARRLDALAEELSGRIAATEARLEAAVETRLETRLEARLRQPEQQLRQVTAKAKDAHRLAVEAARAVERLLQAELELWQAIDANHSNRDVSAAP